MGIQNRGGQVIDLYAYKRNNGAHIYAWNRKNGSNQRWSLNNIGGGRYLIKSQHSKKCLDNTGTVRVNRHYHQWNCNKGNKNQHFRVVNAKIARKPKRNPKRSPSRKPKRNPKRSPSKKPKGKGMKPKGMKPKGKVPKGKGRVPKGKGMKPKGMKPKGKVPKGKVPKGKGI